MSYGDNTYEKLFSAEIAKYSRAEREQYEESLKYYRDIKNIIDTAFEDGELKSKLEIAKKMKAKGIDHSTISELTGLSIEEIEKL
jgi:predicted transposase/invertase (TIGR01784 family)